MRLDMLILAEAATGADGKLYIHGGGITKVAAPSMPWVQPPLAVVGRVEIQAGDEKEPHEIEIALLDPAGKPAFPPARLSMPVAEFERVEGEEVYLQFAVTLGPLVMSQVGTFRWEVRVDGDLQRTMAMPVFSTPPASQETAPESGGS